jgi:hypothetical protein
MNVDSTKPVDYMKIYIKIFSITLFGKNTIYLIRYISKAYVNCNR